MIFGSSTLDPDPNEKLTCVSGSTVTQEPPIGTRSRRVWLVVVEDQAHADTAALNRRAGHIEQLDRQVAVAIGEQVGQYGNADRLRELTHEERERLVLDVLVV